MLYGAIELFLSKTLEAAYSDGLIISGTDFLRYQTTEDSYPVPQVDKTSDAARNGSGTRYPKKFRNSYARRPSFRIADDFNTELGALLMHRHLSGAVTATPVPTPVVPNATDFECLQLDARQGGQLKYFAGGGRLGSGFEPLFYGLCVPSFTVSQQGGAPPTFVAEVLGSGLSKEISAIVPAFVMPPFVDPHAMYGPPTELTYFNPTANAGAGATIALCGRQVNWSLQSSWNVDANKTRQCDKPIDPTNLERGFFYSYPRIGVPSLTLNVRVELDTTKAEQLANQNNTDIQNFRVHMLGERFGTALNSERATSDLYVPLSSLTDLSLTKDGEDAVLDLTFTGREDPITHGLWKAITRAAQTTLQ